MCKNKVRERGGEEEVGCTGGQEVFDFLDVINEDMKYFSSEIPYNHDTVVVMAEEVVDAFDDIVPFTAFFLVRGWFGRRFGEDKIIDEEVIIK